MKNMITICLLFLLINRSGFTAGERTSSGGRALAMGGTSVAVSDFWSLSNNQAGTAWLKEFSAGLGFENRFLVKELMIEQSGVALPLKKGTFGLIVTRFGNTEYNEIKAGFSFARKFGSRFAAAVQIDYVRIHLAGEYGNKNLASVEIGMMYHADRHLSVGVQILNPVPVNITTYPVEQLPTVICTGISYRFSDEFLTVIEAEKDLQDPLVIRTGAEYHFAKPAWARIGLSTSPMSFTFGFGLEFGNVRLDMASGYHQALGFSPSGSVIYSFK